MHRVREIECSEYTTFISFFGLPGAAGAWPSSQDFILHAPIVSKVTIKSNVLYYSDQMCHLTSLAYVLHFRDHKDQIKISFHIRSEFMMYEMKDL